MGDVNNILLFLVECLGSFIFGLVLIIDGYSEGFSAFMVILFLMLFQLINIRITFDKYENNQSA